MQRAIKVNSKSKTHFRVLLNPVKLFWPFRVSMELSVPFGEWMAWGSYNQKKEPVIQVWRVR